MSSSKGHVGNVVGIVTLGLFACSQPAASTERPSTTVPSAQGPEAGAEECVVPSSLLTEPGSPRGLCEGGTQLDLSAAELAFPFEPSTWLWARNGGGQLFVDGECRYWARPGQRLLEMRSGALSPVEASELAAALRYSEWTKWYGWLGNVEVFDGSIVLFWDLSGALGCRMGCGAGQETPPSASPGYQCLIDNWRPMFSAFEAWHEALFERGTPLDGPVRVRAAPYQPSVIGDPNTIYEWPATLPFEEVTFQKLADAPGGVLVEGSDADALRTLRNRARDYYYAPGSTLMQAQILIMLGEVAYEVEIDDALPFEGEDGLVPKDVVNLGVPFEEGRP